MPRERCSSEGLPMPHLLLALLGLSGVSAAPLDSTPLDLAVERLIVDADPGADDALALLLLQSFANGTARSAAAAAVGVHAPKMEAITCVNGNANISTVVYNAFRVLDTANRLDLPVYAGAAASLVITPQPDFYWGDDGFGEVEGNRSKYDGLLKNEHAVNFLIEKVTQSPGEITLLCLGPLTNVALAERLHKGFVSKLRHLIVLGTSVEGRGNVKPGVEFNTYMDPESLHVVLEAAEQAKKPLLLIPWETVSLRVHLSQTWRKKVLGALDSPAMRLMNQAERLSLDQESDFWPAADGVAAAVVLDPRLATRVTKPLHVSVSLANGPARATVHVDYDNVTRQPPNARIVVDVRAEGLKQMLLEHLQ